MDRQDVDDAVSLLQRATILAACRDGPVDRSTIADKAGCSRATAYRATNELTERGLVTKAEGGYQLTGVGTAMLAHVDGFEAGLAGTRRLAPVLAHVDAPELVANAELFTDARVITADPASPYRIDQELEAIVGGTSREMVGATSTFSSPAVMERTYEVIRDGVPAEWVLTRSAFEGVVAQHGEGHDELLALDTTANYLVDEVPFDIAIYDDTLVVPGYDEGSGVVAAMAITENPAAVEWARGVFESIREGADRQDSPPA